MTRVWVTFVTRLTVKFRAATYGDWCFRWHFLRGSTLSEHSSWVVHCRNGSFPVFLTSSRTISKAFMTQTRVTNHLRSTGL